MPWRSHQPLPNLEELTKKYEADPESMTELEMKRLIRQWNRARIKKRNAEKSKKK